MKKKRKKLRREDSSSGGSDNNFIGSNVEKKSRLRRHRGGSSIPFTGDQSDSGMGDGDRQKRDKKKRKKRKSSRATSQLTSNDVSSDWDDDLKKTSKITTGEATPEVKELTEKDLVEKMQNFVLPLDNQMWTKWTLGPLYNFVRNPETMITIAILIPSADQVESPTLSSSKVVSRILKKIYTEDDLVTNESFLVTFNEIIPDYTGEFTYFLKSDEVKIDGDNYEMVVTCGSVPSGHAQAFGLLLSQLLTPFLMTEELFSGNIKDELLTDFNTLSCSAQNIARVVEDGQVFLYTPQEIEAEKVNLLELSKDKGFCSRLEETVVFWLTKLKQVVILKELEEDNESLPQEPLAEINFWMARKTNLEEILRQLKSPQMKRLLKILVLSRSPYLSQLRDIYSEVQKVHKEAVSNSQHLQVLLEPCNKLPGSRLYETPKIIRTFIWSVLVIYRHAPHYNTPQNLNGIMKRFGNAMVRHCGRRIKLNLLFQGMEIKSTEKTIHQCLKCLGWWKDIYRKIEVGYRNGRGDDWPLASEEIFMNTDAMIQRMHDLLEICMIQRMFGRITDDSGESEPLPLYPGLKGPMITQVMEDVEETLFTKLKQISKHSGLILNVKSTEWNEHMKDFQVTVLSMEMTIQNLLEESYDEMSNLKRKLELLELFCRFSSREVIFRQIEKLTIRLWEDFEEDVLRLRSLFERKVVPLPFTFPQMAGQGCWNVAMKNRIEGNLEMLKKAEGWLPKSIFGECVKSEAKSLAEALSGYALKVYEEWRISVEIVENQGGFLSRLETPLLIRAGRERRDVLELNFDRSVFQHMMEAEMWKRLGHTLPPEILDNVFPSRKKFHMLRENVSVIAKYYNKVVSVMSRDERLLFKEQILPLEKKIYPFVSSVTWSSETFSMDHHFLSDYKKLAEEILRKVKLYKDCNLKVAQITSKISRWRMIDISTKEVYEGSNFQDAQTQVLQMQLKRVLVEYKKVVNLLHQLYQAFQEDGPEVQIQWEKYTNLIDGCVEEALRLCLQNSLLILADLVCAAKKPMFRVEMRLEGDTLRYHPSLEALTEMIMGVHRNIALAFQHLSRIGQFLTVPAEGSGSDIDKPQLGLMTQALLRDQLSLEIQTKIKFAIDRCFSELGLYSERWTAYEDVWKLGKDSVIQHYEKEFPAMTAIEKDLGKYLEISEVVHGAESVVNVRFLKVDCTHLKNGISEHSAEWFRLLGESLYKKGKDALLNIYQYMDSNKNKIQKSPETLDEQMDSVELLQTLMTEVHEKVILFPRIHQQFHVLEKFKFPLDQDIMELSGSLQNSWRRYTRFLDEMERNLQKTYDKLRVAFLDQTEVFKGKVLELSKDFDTNGPFSLESVPKNKEHEALEKLDKFLEKTGDLKEQEIRLTKSLKVFNVIKHPNPFLIGMQSDIADLTEVWRQILKWTKFWPEHNHIFICYIPLENLRKEVTQFASLFSRLHKKFERKSWPVLLDMVQLLDKVQTSLKIVPYLTAPSVRDRHWKDIKEVAKATSLMSEVPKVDELTLENILSLQLYLHTGHVFEVSSCSEKEVTIEKALRNIEEFWKAEKFHLWHRSKKKTAGVYVIIFVSDHVKETLMDHVVTLSAMKGSQYIHHFYERIIKYENDLSLVHELLEKLLEVQKEWLFLENVFLAGEIGKEMPRQAKQFAAVSSLWTSIILVISENRNILEATTKTEELEEMLENIAQEMQKLRKSLRTFLQGKRQDFPRFYFIPDHDLLECLGSSNRQPQTILHVIRKMFGKGVSKLKIYEGSGDSLNAPLEIAGIISPEGEHLEFSKPVVVTSPLESWLKKFEEGIKSGVKMSLSKCLGSIQLHSSRQSGWLLENIFLWPNQCLLTTLRIQWTFDATRAIHSSSFSKNEPIFNGDITLKKLGKRLRRDVTKLSRHFQQDSEDDIENLNRHQITSVLVTLMYLRDVTERLHQRNCSDLSSFEWLQFLRYYWFPTKSGSECVIKQAFAQFPYGFEYDSSGVGGHVVITPLMERSLLALTTAMSFHYGAFLHGVANAGKREMVKELGRHLGRYVLNLNLSKHTEQASLSAAITGIMETGSWLVLTGLENCPTELITLVSNKVALICKAKTQMSDKLMLEGAEVRINMNCAIIGVIGGNAGGYDDNRRYLRTLKAGMRPVSILQPDHKSILDVRFFLAGFENSAIFAAKIEVIFTSAKELMGNQTICQFSLDGMFAVVQQAANFKQTFGSTISPGEAILKSLESIILPALTPAEIQIFNDLVNQEFPTDEPPRADNTNLEQSIGKAFSTLQLKVFEKMVKQCLHLHKLMEIYKIIILVGATCTGKSTLRKVLKTALMSQPVASSNKQTLIKEFVINPATFEVYEFYGSTNKTSGQWNDGVLTKILKHHNPENPLWIVFDGPTDFAEETGYENCPQVDFFNGDLTLANCDKLECPSQMWQFLEVDNLKNASPGIIARAGVLYTNNETDKQISDDWKLSLEIWLQKHFKNVQSTILSIMEKCLLFRNDHCSTLIHNLSSHTITGMFIQLMTSFLESLSQEKERFSGESRENKMSRLFRQVMYFSIIWAVFGDVTGESQLKASAFLKDLDSSAFPTKGTVFDYFVDAVLRKWRNWDYLFKNENVDEEDNLRIEMRDDGNNFVRTVGIARTEHILSRYRSDFHSPPVLMAGPGDSGKTKLIMSLMRNHKTGSLGDEKNHSYLHINMTPNLKAKSVQILISTRLQPISSIMLAPARDKQLLVFIDDLNACQRDTCPYQEFLRHIIEHKMWYDRVSGAATALSNVSFISAMSLGKTEISPRLQSKFSVLFVPKLDDIQLRRIFTTRGKQKLDDFTPAVKLLTDDIAVATLEIYKVISSQFQSTSENPWQIFGLHDISKVYDGLGRATKDIQDTKLCLLRLWFHECTRVFHDRLLDSCSRAKCREILRQQLLKHFELPYKSLCQSGSLPMFGTFLNTSKITPGYEEIQDVSAIQKLLEETAEAMRQNGMMSQLTPRKAIFFKRAIHQVARIARVLSETKGHLIICGQDGQGRETLVRLVSYLYNYQLHQLDPSCTFASRVDRTRSFCRVVKEAVYNSICENIPTCILVKDEQISEEILELVSLLISSVELPDLFTKIEVKEMKEKVLRSADAALKLQDADNASWMDYFRTRAENNLHVVLCINPSNKILMAYISEFPVLLKRMTLNHFDIWRKESYHEVSNTLLPMSSPIQSISPFTPPLELCYSIHEAVSFVGEKVVRNVQRFAHITPVHFIDFLEQYSSVTQEVTQVNTEKIKLLTQSIEEIGKVRSQIDTLVLQANQAQLKVEESQRECDNLLEVLGEQESETSSQSVFVAEKSCQLDAQIKEYDDLAQVIKTEWGEALEEFENATSVFLDVSDEDVTHILSYHTPPPPVATVLEAATVMLDLEISTTAWSEVKVQLGAPDFITNIVQYDKARITMDKLTALRQYTEDPEFTAEAVSKHSNFARCLFIWIQATAKYGTIYLTQVFPSREKLEISEQAIMERRHSLDLHTQKLQILSENLADLQNDYKVKAHLKEGLEADYLHSTQVLQRARNVLELMEDIVVKWEQEICILKKKLQFLPGDALLSAACLAYLGPFCYNFREVIKRKWIPLINSVTPISPDWKLVEKPISLYGFLSPERILYLNENLAMLKSCLRFPLLIDPHSITEKYILKENKNQYNFCHVEGSESTENYLKTYRQFLDEQNEPLMRGEISRKSVLITKQLDPDVTRTVATRFQIINFTFSEEDLKNCFKAEVCRIVHPTEETKLRILFQTSVAEQREIFEATNAIPRLVISCASSILTNNNFLESLRQRKTELSDSEEKLEEITEETRQLETNKEEFTRVALMLTVMYESICEIAQLSPNYTVSLEYFCGLLRNVLQGFSTGTKEDESPCPNYGETEAFMKETGVISMFRTLCRSMFAHDRYQFGLLCCIKVLCENHNPEIFQQVSFLSSVFNQSHEKNCEEDTLSWLGLAQLENLKRLDKLTKFQGILESFQIDFSTWQVWLEYLEPETKLPGKWSTFLNSFEKLILISVLRPDRAFSQIRYLTTEVLGATFAKIVSTPELIDLKEIYESTSDKFPVIIFLIRDNDEFSPDPNSSIISLADSINSAPKVYSLSLSNENTHLTRRLLEEGLKMGHWIYMTNCHLAVEWMWQMQRILEEYHTGKKISWDSDSERTGEFRLWLRTSYHESYPSEIIKHATKIVVESPQTFHMGFSRLQHKMKAQLIMPGKNQDKDRLHNRLVKNLVFLHCQLSSGNILPRQIAKSSFTTMKKHIASYVEDSDFEICAAILKIFFKYTGVEQVEWWALKYMVELQYTNNIQGGMLSKEEEEQLLIHTLVQEYLTEESILPEESYEIGGECATTEVGDCFPAERSEEVANTFLEEFAKIFSKNLTTQEIQELGYQ